MTLQERIDRKLAELATLKPRSERRTIVLAQLRDLRTKQIPNENIVDEIAA